MVINLFTGLPGPMSQNYKIFLKPPSISALKIFLNYDSTSAILAEHRTTYYF